MPYRVLGRLAVYPQKLNAMLNNRLACTGRRVGA
jgi:hypothetical protein